MAQPPGMEWQSYFNNLPSISGIMAGTETPGIGGKLLGHAINALAGEDTDIGNKFGGNKPIFGAVPAPAQQPSVAPVMPVIPPVGGQQSITQPQVGTTIQQPVETQIPSFSRFLYSPKG